VSLVTVSCASAVIASAWARAGQQLLGLFVGTRLSAARSASAIRAPARLGVLAQFGGGPCDRGDDLATRPGAALREVRILVVVVIAVRKSGIFHAPRCP
jgi:hypothetical protein